MYALAYSVNWLISTSSIGLVSVSGVYVLHNITGLVMNDKRSSLSAEKLNHVCFIHDNTLSRFPICALNRSFEVN